VFEHPAEAADHVLTRIKVDLLASSVDSCFQRRHAGQVGRTDERE
jgi:hypothetical protein